MASIGGIMKGAFKAFMAVAKLATKIPPLIAKPKPPKPGRSKFSFGLTGGPLGAPIYKFLKFCVYSSLILIFFMMGGMTFSAFALMYVYYKLYKEISQRDDEIRAIENST